METVGEILRQILGGDYRLREALCLEKLQKAWPQVADDSLGQRVQPSAYKNKTLFLTASSSVWAQQVVFYKQLIMTKYKALEPGIEIKEIRVRSGQVSVPEKTVPADQPEAGEPPDSPEADPGTKLQRIIRKAGRWLRRDRRRICPVCQRRFEGTEAVCIFCRNQAQAARDARIARYLAETPWVKYAEIRADLPDTREEDFWRVRQKLQQQTLDALRRLFFEYYQRPLPERAREQALRQAAYYVLLKTGLTPDKIDDNIISGQLSRKLYKFIYGQKQ
ncbi:MAG: DciA family protein [Candidatus Margulisbacteria bacterium]|jgi:hypothetical protein|nr:DciA family protein [Candidatus Margulisiibacteriota bacterium]